MPCTKFIEPVPTALASQKSRGTAVAITLMTTFFDFRFWCRAGRRMIGIDTMAFGATGQLQLSRLR